MNLYVGNLSHSTTQESLTNAFSKFGPVVSVKIITDRFSGQSRGFGFVELENKDNGLKAITELDGTELDGRQIKVNEARPREENKKRDNFRRNKRNN